MARRPARPKLEKASTAGLRKLSPAENVKAGFSPKAERYVLKGARVTKRTATLSKRRYLEKQTAERGGLAKPLSLEKAAEARRAGGLGYSSAESAEQAVKQRDTRYVRRSLKSVGRVRDLKGRPYRPGHLDSYEELRRRKLAGENLSDTDWFSLMDVARAIDDPRLADLQRSAHVGPMAA